MLYSIKIHLINILNANAKKHKVITKLHICLGYADLFTLSKDDLWEALEEYPEAKQVLLEKGKQILMKDNMIDEEKAATDAAERELLEKNVNTLNEKLDVVTERMASFIAEFTSFQLKTKQRMTSLEAKKGIIESS